MEEGDFDKQGHYHFKKDNDIRDNWMDEIDWVSSLLAYCFRSYKNSVLCLMT